MISITSRNYPSPPQKCVLVKSSDSIDIDYVQNVYMGINA